MLRIDKFLWAIRIFKTRSEAAEACKHDRVTLGNRTLKASYEVKVGDVIVVRKNAVHYHYQVVALPTTRVSAKLAAAFAADLTPPTELDKLDTHKMLVFAQRKRGSGRPTKRDRRKLEEVLG
ncbi:heat-shock protein Hsp15 [Bacteroidia bacterium]|nr:heat-shock protein Hsp15 [Bacteroidia bacterium]